LIITKKISGLLPGVTHLPFSSYQLQPAVIHSRNHDGRDGSWGGKGFVHIDGSLPKAELLSRQEGSSGSIREGRDLSSWPAINLIPYGKIRCISLRILHFKDLPD
jgi:hypothetical protein